MALFGCSLFVLTPLYRVRKMCPFRSPCHLISPIFYDRSRIRLRFALKIHMRVLHTDTQVSTTHWLSPVLQLLGSVDTHLQGRQLGVWSLRQKGEKHNWIWLRLYMSDAYACYTV